MYIVASQILLIVTLAPFFYVIEIISRLISPVASNFTYYIYLSMHANDICKITLFVRVKVCAESERIILNGTEVELKVCFTYNCLKRVAILIG